MQHIKSARRGSDEFHSIISPVDGSRMYRAAAGDYVAKNPKATLKLNGSSFEIFIDGDSALTEFDPAKAYDKGDLPAKLGDDPIKVASASWYEPKRDGARAILHFTQNGIRFTGRRRNASGEFSEWADNVPHLRDIAFPDSMIGMVLDAEIVVELVPGSKATGTLGATMSVVGASSATAIETQQKFGRAHVYVFDAIFGRGGVDLRKLPLTQRRETVEEAVSALDSTYIHAMEYVILHDQNERRAFFATQLENNHEGCVAKNPNAAYGERYSWLKVKQEVTIDVIVVGFDFGKKGGKHANTVGALCVAVLTPDHQLVEVVNLVPGTDEKRAELKKLFDATQTSGATIESLGMVIEVEAQGWTKENRLRHARIVRFRPDRSAPNTVDFSTVEKI